VREGLIDGQTTERQCAYCGGDFEPTYDGAKHCRPSCRKGAEDARRKGGKGGNCGQATLLISGDNVWENGRADV
jgi:hypothetical protein